MFSSCLKFKHGYSKRIVLMIFTFQKFIGVVKILLATELHIFCLGKISDIESGP